MKKSTALLLTLCLVLSLTGCGGQNTEEPREIPDAQTAQLAAAAADKSASELYGDVAPDAPYGQAVVWCYEQGLMEGYGANFAPEGVFDRKSMAVVLYRVAGRPEVSEAPAFTDVAADDWFADAVVWASAEGLMVGFGGKFTPYTPMSVEMLTVLLDRYMGRGDTWKGDAALAEPATRAEIAVALYENLKDRGNTPESSPSTRVLIAFFSRADENYGVGAIEKGNTHIVAEMIGEQTGGDLFHIETVKKYPAVYSECTAVAQQEKNENARPELTGTVDNFDSYDIVFLGYPIWWGDLPMAVYTFMESYDWAGKTVVPFCTHAGSGLSGTPDKIRSALSGATVLDGLAIAGTTAQNDRDSTRSSVKSWLDGLDLNFAAPASSDTPVVYMTASISPEGLMEVYRILNWTPTGKVAVKLSTGEPPASNYLRPELIKDVVQVVNGTQLKENYVGAAFGDYDSYLVLSHFKGHGMAGFGEAIKNISIGLGSSEGKSWIHTAGKSKTSPWGGDQDAFCEAMAEAGKSVSDYLGNGERIVYVNVMNRLSVDCDCSGRPAEPDLHDIGILASTDPVALDRPASI